jgi:hypothetical protein
VLSVRLDEAEARADARAAARRARNAPGAIVEDPDGVLPEDGSAGRGDVDADLFDGGEGSMAPSERWQRRGDECGRRWHGVVT